MKKKIKVIITIAICLIIIVLILLFAFYNKDSKVNSKLYGTSFNYKLEDEEGMKLYNRYQIEDGILFNFVGSNMYDNYYGYFYKDDLNLLPNFLKNIVLIKEVDHGGWDYDIDNMCYKLSLDSYKKLYNNLYGDDEFDFSVDDNLKEKIMVDDNNICISDVLELDYTKTIDTYLVNIVRLNNKIVIYERVLFIDIKKDYLYFYKDLEMKELIYKLDINDKLDYSFINNSEVVSNVLLEYQDELDIYEYTYAKGEDEYYLENISK